MSDNYHDPLWTAKVSVPVKRVGDRWEFFYGGDVPVKDGTLGELTLSADQISDDGFRQRVTAEASFQVLEEGTTLLVALSDRLRCTPYAEFGAQHFPQGIPPSTSCWEHVRLGPPRKNKVKSQVAQQEFVPETGGLWLRLKGLDKCELFSSTIQMPEKFMPAEAQSLNHALTLLSRRYETHRISNFVNVYTRVYYQDKDECWYPLDDLRRGVQAKAERKLLTQLWAEVESALGWRPIHPHPVRSRKTR